MAKISVWLVLLLLIALPIPLRADAPALIPIQGMLTDAGGTALQGNVSMVLSLYPSATGGNALYSETREVQATDGLFTVYLGEEQAVDLSLFLQTGEVWLGIQVEADSEMTRVRLGSVPYSGFSQHTRGPTLGDLTCDIDLVARWNGSAWECADAARGPTLGDLTCDIDLVARWNGSAWECADAARGPTLADLSCATDQVARFNGSLWECVDIPAVLPSMDITLAQWDGNGDTFAAGVSVFCPAGYQRVGCGHTCNDGPHDTQSWPVDGEGCRGHEAAGDAHGGLCSLYAICLRLTP